MGIGSSERSDSADGRTDGPRLRRVSAQYKPFRRVLPFYYSRACSPEISGKQKKNNVKKQKQPNTRVRRHRWENVRDRRNTTRRFSFLNKYDDGDFPDGFSGPVRKI